MRFTAILLLLVASLFLTQAADLTVNRYCGATDSTCSVARNSTVAFPLTTCTKFNDICGAPIQYVNIVQDTANPKIFTAFAFNDVACKQSFANLNVTSECGLCVAMPSPFGFISVDCPPVASSEDSSFATKTVASAIMVLISIIAALL